MGHSQADKAESHQRIVDVAARRFRELGLDGISVADVMKEAGMTVGGFYKHFATRDDLVAEAMEAACRQMDDSVITQQPTLKQGIETYLSEAHRDDIADGCPLAALVNDTARSAERTRQAFTDRFETSLARLASQMPDDTPGNRRARAMLIYSSYIGALGLARAVPDAALSREVLDSVATQLVALVASERDTLTT